MKALVTAGLSDYKLRTKLVGLLDNEQIDEIVLVRRAPLRSSHPKLKNVNPRGPFAASRLLYEFWRTWTLWRLAGRGADVVMGIQLVLHGVQAALVGRLRRIPAVLSVIGDDVHIHLLSWWKRPMLAWSVRQAAAATVMGPESRRKLCEVGVPAFKTFEIQNYQDIGRFRPRGGEIRWDFIFVGDLIPRKRVDALLDAISDVARAVSGIQLAIVGDGPERHRLETRARELNIENQVDFLGRQEEVEKFLNASRAFVLISSIEALPAAAIEAMYCGLPAVLTSVCDIPGLFVHEENALLVSLDDHSGLVAALRQMIKDPELYARLREGALRSRGCHAEKWNSEGQVRRWSELLDSVSSSALASHTGTRKAS